MASDDENSGQSKKLILLAILTTALVGVVGYQFFYLNKPTKPLVRKTKDFVVTWRCLNCDNTLQANADRGPKKCPKCNQDQLYASLPWYCPEHGAVPVAFQYDQDGQPTQIRMPKGEWIDAIREPTEEDNGGWNIFCPKCKKVMGPVGA